MRLNNTSVQALRDLLITFLEDPPEAYENASEDFELLYALLESHYEVDINITPVPFFQLSEDNEELIHRVFGGNQIIRSSVKTIRIIRSSVKTVNTGGYVMNDLYRVKDRPNIVVVHEYGAVLLPNRDTYETDYYNSNYPTFEWDEPLDGPIRD